VSPSALAAREASARGLCPSDGEGFVAAAACADLIEPGAGNFLYTNGNVTYKATKDLNMTLTFSKNRLVREDTGRVAFDSNIASLKTTYQFTRFAFARARVDYESITSRYSGQSSSSAGRPTPARPSTSATTTTSTATTTTASRSCPIRGCCATPAASSSKPPTSSAAASKG
jgi:hypothetical protein